MPDSRGGWQLCDELADGVTTYGAQVANADGPEGEELILLSFLLSPDGSRASPHYALTPRAAQRLIHWLGQAIDNARPRGN